MKALIVLALCAGSARADLLNHELLRRHAAEVVARTPPERRADLRVHRWPLVARTVIPVYGTWTIEERVFGGLRPSGVVFDWVIGGAAPVGLGIAALATGDRTYAWAGLGLYAATRAAIFVIANLHIGAWNHAVEIRNTVTSHRNLEVPGRRRRPLRAGT